MTAQEHDRPGAKEQLAALGQVMGELVHDLGNEVEALQGWAFLARGELEAGRQPMTEIERVVEISTSLGEMLHDLMSTLAGQTLSPEVSFDPLDVTRRTLSYRSRSLPGVRIRLRASLPEDVRIAGRASFWTRALTNLLSNAARHARSDILVLLGAEGADAGSRDVVLRVEDDGAGIAPGEREAMFLPFWRGETGRLGLGLSSAAWAVAQLRGQIHYRDDSSLDGAAFEIRVPAATPIGGPPPVQVEAHAPTAAIRNARVLLVEDDAGVRQALARLLRRAGAEVQELDPTGVPGEQLLHEIEGALPDVLLLDLRLGGRDGLSVWERISLQLPRLADRIAFISGASPGDHDWEQARLTGCPMLGKPVDLRQLMDVVSRLRAKQDP